VAGYIALGIAARLFLALAVLVAFRAAAKWKA